MTDCEINVTVEDAVSIDVTIQDEVSIVVQVEGGVANNYINEGDKFYLDGPSGTTWITKNASTGRAELWRDGVRRQYW